jgi:hypothetical protein
MADNITGILNPGNETIGIEIKMEKMGDFEFGEIWGEATKSPPMKSFGKPIPRLIKHITKLNGKDYETHYHIGVPPPNIDPEKHYPSKIMIMSSNRYDTMDYVPQDTFKRYMFIDEQNQPVNVGGVVPEVYYYTQVSIQQVDEERECSVVTGPLIQGKDILAKQDAKNGSISLIGVGGFNPITSASQGRNRMDEDENVHVINPT